MAGKKQGQIDKIGDTSKPEFKGPGIEGKKVFSSVVTIRDGGPKRILFGADGKEIGVEEPPFSKEVPEYAEYVTAQMEGGGGKKEDKNPDPAAGDDAQDKAKGPDENEKQDPVA